MHEMSIALNIIDLIKEEVKKNYASVVKEFEVEVGSVSGVEIEALKFALEIAVKDTFMEKTKQTITPVAATALCLECNKDFSLSWFYEPCPFCNAINIKIIKGKELKIKSITVD